MKKNKNVSDNEEEQKKNMNDLKFCNRIFKEIKKDMKKYSTSELKHFKLISLILYKLDIKKINKFKFAIKKEAHFNSFILDECGDMNSNFINSRMI